ncbi:N-acetyl-gamma-glutamyl-phosphate reductase [Jonesia quinghaiensis]|uniref:N-acetyl-gamma-glutamyl-phosphate reductase n=1 Tax=Jonesia quinghaiensis TaxID=262806 RepID=UPI00048C6383|nr:N-acetyl-gamma-glutamyl-phosphate reductase [Jonesia quinghaiensis]
MHMTVTVAVAGASGYAGGEVLRLLAAHPHVNIGAVTAHTQAGARVGDVHPHLVSLADRILQPTTAESLAGHDVVVLALPHGTSATIAAQLPSTTLVLDLGADHRLTQASDWEHYYGGQYSGAWTYGMPELHCATGDTQRDKLSSTRRIAVPGCNVTAVTLGMQPAVTAGLVDTTALTAVLAVGYSGAGKSLKPHLLAAEALGSAMPYAVGGSHRHIPEIMQNLRSAGASDVNLSFTPILVPMSRGILATISAPLVAGAEAPTTKELHTLWQATYANEPFMTVLPAGRWPTSGATTGSNTAHMQVAWDDRARRITVVCAIDNLVKGTAGAAIQSMNIALGFKETLGLTTEGVTP